MRVFHLHSVQRTTHHVREPRQAHSRYVQTILNVPINWTVQLTTEELALYDRQIRLWGADTQVRLQSARILVINLGALGTEIVKNLVLGGISSIEIVDDSCVKEEDFAAQFFLPKQDSIIGTPKLPHVLPAIKELNTRVDISINTQGLGVLLEDYVESFDLIVATELSKRDLIHVNHLTRSRQVPLYAAGLHGMFGYIFADLIRHESTKVYEKGNQPRVAGSAINEVKTIVSVVEADEDETVTVADEYFPLEQMFGSRKLARQLNKRQMRRLSPAVPLVFALFDVDKPASPADLVDKAALKQKALEVCHTFLLAESVISDEYLEYLSTQAFAEFSPVAAVLGGVLAQDIIQYYSKKDSPINNCLVFDGVQMELPVYFL